MNSLGIPIKLLVECLGGPILCLGIPIKNAFGIPMNSLGIPMQLLVECLGIPIESCLWNALESL